MEGKRTQFTFYESFFKAASRIKKKADRADAYDVICAYALYGTEPDLDKLPDSVAVVFEMCKPNLTASRRKAENGKKGGERKQAETKRKQSASKSKQTEATANQVKEQVQEKEQVQDKDKEQMLGSTPLPPVEPKPEAKPEEVSQEDVELGRLPVVLQPVMQDWLEYKKQRKEKYTPVGLTALISEVMNNTKKYGEGAVAQVIRTSMASGYKGIIFDRLQQQAGKGRKEMVPAWADKPSQFAQDAVKRMLEQEKNAGNDPELAERAEQLRRSLGG